MPTSIYYNVTGTTVPSNFAVGDLAYATAANTLAGLADVAAGQVLVSGGVATAPAYSATPTVTSVTATAGTGSQTGKVPVTVYNDVSSTASSTGGTVNVSTYTMPANTLAADGQSLEIRACALHAANTQAVTYRLSIFGTLLATVSSADSGGLACAVLTVTRKSSSVVDVIGYEMSSGSFTQVRVRITGVDFTSASANTIFEQFGVSTSNSDLTGEFLHILWWP